MRVLLRISRGNISADWPVAERIVTRCLAVLIALTIASPATAETEVERGAYLVNGIGTCGNCHSPQNPDGTLSGPAFSGGKAIISPAFTAYPPNLTSDIETGLGRWSEDQIVTAIREGRKPDGTLIRPPMPVGLYRGISDRDAHAMAAYLKSLPPVRNNVPASQYAGPVPTSYGPPVGVVPDPSPADPVAYGRYLVQFAHCLLCHSPEDAQGRPDLANHPGAGGAELQGVFGDIVTPNITPDVKTGIGGWSDLQIANALTKGVRPDGIQLASPMPWRYLATLHRADIAAIIAYLHTLRPIVSR